MTSHELAKILLENDDLPIAVFANNHTYSSKSDSCSHGTLKVGRLYHYSGEHIIIGNVYKKDINNPNWYITDMIHGDVQDN